MHRIERNITAFTLPTSSRIYRLLIGSALIATTMFINMETANWISLLPLIAIYFIVSAIMAKDPINALTEQWDILHHADVFSPITRVILILAGCGLIGFSLFDTSVANTPVWLSLAAIPLCLSGVFGEDLLRAALDEKYEYDVDADIDNKPTLPSPPQHPAPVPQAGSSLLDRAA